MAEARKDPLPLGELVPPNISIMTQGRQGNHLAILHEQWNALGHPTGECNNPAVGHQGLARKSLCTSNPFRSESASGPTAGEEQSRCQSHCGVVLRRTSLRTTIPVT